MCLWLLVEVAGIAGAVGGVCALLFVNSFVTVLRCCCCVGSLVFVPTCLYKVSLRGSGGDGRGWEGCWGSPPPVVEWISGVSIAHWLVVVCWSRTLPASSRAVICIFWSAFRSTARIIQALLALIPTCRVASRLAITARQGRLQIECCLLVTLRCIHLAFLQQPSGSHHRNISSRPIASLHSNSVPIFREPARRYAFNVLVENTTNRAQPLPRVATAARPDESHAYERKMLRPLR